VKTLSNFPTLILTALVAGTGVRVLADSVGVPPTASTRLSASVPGPGAQAVEKFYRAVIVGDYATASGYSREVAAETPAGAVRTVTAAQFVAQLREELGPNGLNVGISKLHASSLTPVTRAAAFNTREGHIVKSSSDRVAQVYVATVEGKLVGRCAIGDFTRDVLVARWEDGTWTILLEGRRSATAPHFETWFLTRVESHSEPAPRSAA